MSDTNRRMAEALGWHVVAYEHFDPHGFHYELKDAAGRSAGRALPIAGSEDEAWLGIYNWDTDMNEAIKLVPKDANFELSKVRYGGGWEATFDEYTFETASTPAEAICRAFLAWHEAQ